MTSARVLVPLTITASMIKAGTTIAEPDTANGEQAWVSGGNYIVDDLRTSNGSVWSCVKAHSGRTSLPENEAPGYWLRKGPTNRQAMFDDYRSTTASAVGTLTVVLQPDLFNGISIWQMEGDTYSITVKNAPGGTVIASKAGDLYEQAAGYYELMLMPLPKLQSVSLYDIPLSATAEVTITITASGGNRASLGVVKVGDWCVFIGEGEGEWGGVNYGASSKRHSYTYREYNEDGSLKRTIPRGNRRDVRATVEVSAEAAMYVDALLERIADTAVVFEATDLPRYGYLNSLGFLDAEMTAQDFGTTKIDITHKGNI